MGKVVYRTPGMACHKSMIFHEDIVKAGWSKEICDNFIKGVPGFESNAIAEPWENGLRSFMRPPPVEFLPFLKELHGHIRMLTQAQRYEAMQDRATNMNHPEFLNAQKWFFDAADNKKRQSKK
jgi:hypothetical protein